MDSNSNGPVVSPQLPPRKRQLYSDRFIPLRSSNYGDLFASKEPSLHCTNKESGHQTSVYNLLLKSEILGLNEDTAEARPKSSSTWSVSSPHRTLNYKHKEERPESPFSLSPISECSQRLLSATRKPARKISKTPFKVLEAPAIQDDFYLNLVDWSSQNILAVGLSNSVFLWNACTSQVTKLCDLGEVDSVTSVAWIQRGTHLAVGTNSGVVQLWDVQHSKKIRELTGHKFRVGSLAWNANVLSSGSRDRIIFNRDVRSREQYTAKLVGHKQEVCGLKWSFDGQFLASGGNDNKLFIWDSNSSCISKFSDHTAAVKALAWSPHQRGLLASGGGTADRCIRFWNVLQSKAVSALDTGSQVCNLVWSKNVNELVSTHGYSQNQIVIWSYPSMNQISVLTGHTMRVLFLSVSPDGQNVVTGAGDETLRFWNVFPAAKACGSSKQLFSSFSSKNDIR